MLATMRGWAAAGRDRDDAEEGAANVITARSGAARSKKQEAAQQEARSKKRRSKKQEAAQQETALEVSDGGRVTGRAG
jgi:hypothetical protein